MNKKKLLIIGIVLAVAIWLIILKNKSEQIDISKISYAGPLSNFSEIKVAALYQNVTDRKPNGGRSLDETVKALKQIQTDFIFLGFWTWTIPAPDSPDNIPPEMVDRISKFANTEKKHVPELIRVTGYSYKELTDSIAAIKKEMPGVIFAGGIPAEALGRIEIDSITNKVIDVNSTWEMAFDSKKWGISYVCPEDLCKDLPSIKGKLLDKENFQEYFALSNHLLNPGETYNWQTAQGYYPDLTNPDFQKLLVSRAKKQIDSGVDAIWIDLLYIQAESLKKMTNDENHPAVKESYSAASKIIDAIHEYGESKGKKIYIGTWAEPVIYYEWQAPKLDFVTITPTPEEIYYGKFDEVKWNKINSKVEEKFGKIVRFVFIDFGWANNSPMDIFSQKLNKKQQREWLKKADRFFQDKGMIFMYPVHGGDFTPGAQRLSFGKNAKYDSLAPEFDTYETIKELANKKSADFSLDKLFIKSWLSEGAIYETHPYYYPNHSFKEITEQVPYLKDLGIKTIYLMPIWERAMQRQDPNLIYLINNYYNIDPAYGTPDDLRELIDTVHKNDMKILFDFVTCCTPPGSVVYNKGWTYSFSNAELEQKTKEMNWNLEYKTINGRSFVFAGKHKSPTGEKDLYEFAGEISKNRIMVRSFPVAAWGPSVDLGNPEVVKYYIAVAEYYLKEFNIDGWRIDAPANNYNSKVFLGDNSSANLLISARDAAKKIDFDVEFISEPGLSKEVKVEAEYANLGRILSSLTTGQMTSQELVNKLTEKVMASGRAPVLLVESHDLLRINKSYPQLNKNLLVMMSTLPGVPFIQTGQEVGETKDWFKTGNTNPQVNWNNGDNELRIFYKKVFNVRNFNAALKYGEIKNVWKSGDNVYAYSRSYEKETVIVVINFNGNESTSYLNLPFTEETNLKDELSEESFIVRNPDNFKISVPVYSSRILTIKK